MTSFANPKVASSRDTSPIGALVRGVAAGIVGTVVMDAVWYVRYRRGGGQAPPLEWEFGGIDNWDKASAPGRVGKRLAEGFLQRPLPPQAAALAGDRRDIVHAPR